MLVHRRHRGQRQALAHRVLHPGVVPAALPSDTGQVRRGVVGDLVAQVGLERLATARDRVRRPDVRPRGHRQHVGRFRDEHPGRGGPRPGGSDEDNRGDGAAEQVLHHLAHRAVQPAGRVQPNHQRGGVLLLGPVQHPVQVLGRDGIDGALDPGHEHRRAGLVSPRASSEQDRGDDRAEQQAASAETARDSRPCQAHARSSLGAASPALGRRERPLPASYPAPGEIAIAQAAASPLAPQGLAATDRLTCRAAALGYASCPR